MRRAVGRKDSCLLTTPLPPRGPGDPGLAAAAASKEGKWGCGRNVFRANRFFLPPDVLLRVEDMGRQAFRIEPGGRRGARGGTGRSSEHKAKGVGLESAHPPPCSGFLSRK